MFEVMELLRPSDSALVKEVKRVERICGQFDSMLGSLLATLRMPKNRELLRAQPELMDEMDAIVDDYWRRYMAMVPGEFNNVRIDAWTGKASVE